MGWFRTYVRDAAASDRLRVEPDHLRLLAVGLVGETGSVAAETKKQKRERRAYPAYRQRALEELGDWLWYFARLVDIAAPGIITKIERGITPVPMARTSATLVLASRVGDLAAAIAQQDSAIDERLLGAWKAFLDLAATTGIEVSSLPQSNLSKVLGRWPKRKVYAPLKDEDDPQLEQLPRKLVVEFFELRRRDKAYVVLRCNGVTFGDRLTDNSKAPDDYRYHDIFHFSYAVHVGWSPVTRALLSCKRKGRPEIDEVEDGARAAILEEAVSAVVFARAKHMNWFSGQDSVDFDLLKTIEKIVRDYEPESVPLWQWERAILDGYRAFRELRRHHGGRIVLNLRRRTMTYHVHSKQALSWTK